MEFNCLLKSEAYIFLNKTTSRYPFYEYEEMFSRYEILILDLEISHKIMYFFRVFAQDFRPYQLLLAFLVSLWTR